MKKYFQGKFRPLNPSKYKGNPNNILFRSSWECAYMVNLDRDPNVISWASEEIIVHYKSPIDKKYHWYFPDFLVTRINNGRKETILLEIKPDKFTRPPIKKQKITKKYISEVKTWGINEAKWSAAKKYAQKRGWKWAILTERNWGLGWQ